MIGPGVEWWTFHATAGYDPPPVETVTTAKLINTPQGTEVAAAASTTNLLTLINNAAQEDTNGGAPPGGPGPAAPGDLVLVVFGFRGIGSTLTPPAGQGWTQLGASFTDAYPDIRQHLTVWATSYPTSAWASSTWTLAGPAVGTRIAVQVAIHRSVDPDLLANPATYLTFTNLARDVSATTGPTSVPLPARLRYGSNAALFAVDVLGNDSRPNDWSLTSVPANFTTATERFRRGHRSAAWVLDMFDPPPAVGPLPVPALVRNNTNDKALILATLLVPSTLVVTDPPPVPGGEGWTLDPDRSTALEGFTATHGRPDPNSRPPATTAQLELAAEFCPVAPTPGERFQLRLTDAQLTALGLSATDAPRFTGEVTDAVTIPAGKRNAARHQVTAVGRWARLGRRTVVPAGFPRESAAARVSRVLASVAAPAGTIDTDPAVVGSDPTELTAQAAAQLIDTVSESTGSLLVETRAGVLDWQGPNRRRVAATEAIELPAAAVFRDGFTWQRHLSALINDVTVKLIDGTELQLRDGPSVDRHDPAPASIDTVLVSATEGYSLAQLVLARRSRLSWQLPAVTVDVFRTVPDDATRRALLRATTGTRLRLLDLPASPDGAGTTSLDVFVEGVTETIALSPGTHDTPARVVWRLQFAVADAVLSGTTLRWSDLAGSALTWADLPADLTWLDLGRVETTAGLTG